MSDRVDERWGEDVQRFYADRGLGNRVGFGKHPALVVVDMQVLFNDPNERLGADMSEGLEAIATILELARERSVLVAYIWTAYHEDLKDAGTWGKKIPSLGDLTLGTAGVEIHPRIAPAAGDHRVLKKGPSGFFGTNLSSLLLSQGVDTVILTGASTSGCIRATAIDSLSHGFRTILPLEAIGDRAEEPHWANLFDIDAKYGDVVPMSEMLEYLEGISGVAEERRTEAAAARA